MNLGIILTVILALVYAASIDVEALTLIPRQKWVSFANGIVIIYVFVDIFPRLEQALMTLQREESASLDTLRLGCYIIVALGFLIFYGIEKLMMWSHRLQKSDSSKKNIPLFTAILSISAFSMYSSLLSCLLSYYQFDSLLIEQSLLFSVLLLHFIVIDHNLDDYFQTSYQKIGRWVLTGSVVFGALSPVPLWERFDLGHIIWAFIGGGMLINAMNVELSRTQESCFWSFSFGATTFIVVKWLLQS